METKVYNIQILTDEGWQKYCDIEYNAEEADKELKWLRLYNLDKFRKKFIGIRNRVRLTINRPTIA